MVLLETRVVVFGFIMKIKYNRERWKKQISYLLGDANKDKMEDVNVSFLILLGRKLRI